jgi:hypothetical protein
MLHTKTWPAALCIFSPLAGKVLEKAPNLFARRDAARAVPFRSTKISTCGRDRRCTSHTHTHTTHNTQHTQHNTTQHNTTQHSEVQSTCTAPKHKHPSNSFRTKKRRTYPFLSKAGMNPPLSSEATLMIAWSTFTSCVKSVSSNACFHWDSWFWHAVRNCCAFWVCPVKR